MDEGPVGVLQVQQPPPVAPRRGVHPPGALLEIQPPGTPPEIQPPGAQAGDRASDHPAIPMAEPPLAQWLHCGGGGHLGTCQPLLWPARGCAEAEAEAEAEAGGCSFHFPPQGTAACGSNLTVKRDPETGSYGGMLNPEQQQQQQQCSPAVARSSGPEPENAGDHGAASARGPAGGPIQTSCASLLPGPGAKAKGPMTPLQRGSTDTPEEGFAADQLRVVKHKPSAIVFCDYDLNGAQQPTSVATASSDVGDPSPTTTEEEVCRIDSSDKEEVDVFPELFQYKEFLVSRRRRNLNTNRKCLRKRRDVPAVSSANQTTALSMDSKEEEEDGATVQVRRNMMCIRCYMLIAVTRFTNDANMCKLFCSFTLEAA